MKILLLSYENEGQKILSIKKLLEKKGHKCLIIDGSLSSVNHFKQMNKNEYIGLDQPLYSFNKKLINKDFNYQAWKELKIIEEKYMEGRNIINLLRTSPLYFEDHHPQKPYFIIPDNHNIRLNYILEIINWFINLLNKFKPDICICIEGNYLVKQLAACLSKKMKYKYYCFTQSRIMDYIVPINEKLELLENKNKDKYNDEAKKIFTKLKNELLTYEVYDKDATKQYYKNYKANKLKILINNISALSIYLYKFTYLRIIFIFKGFFKKNKPKITYFYSSPLKAIYFTLKSFLRKTYIDLNHYKIFRNNIKSNSDRNNKMKNILYTLHVSPESSILSFSNYHKEEDLINYISKILPIDFRLLVKENKEMIGLRETSFYKRILGLGNVVLIDPYLDPIQTLEISDAIIGNCGTSVFEALIKNIPCALFGYPEYKELVPEKYIGFQGVELFINDLNNKCVIKTEKKKIIEYIAKCISWDITWSLKEWLSIRDVKFKNSNYQEVEKSIVKFLDNLNLIKN